jgi:hypothetical protein
MRILLFIILSIGAYGQGKYDQMMARAAANTISCYFPQTTDVVLKPTDWNIDATKYNIKPGDRIILTGGIRNEIQFTGIKGTKEAPIIVTALEKIVIKGLNKGGRVVIFSGCDYVYVDGGPNQLIEVTGGTQGIDFRDLSNHPKINGVYFHDIGYLGVGMKTDPTCDKRTWRGNFTLYDPVVTNCRFENIMTGEAIYIGESHYATSFPLNCSDGTKSALEHDVSGVVVQNNTFKNIGRNGIQVGAATGGGIISDNNLHGCGMTKEYGQSSPIEINPGSALIVEKNLIDGAPEFAISLQGRTSTVVRYNDVRNAKGGVFTVAREATDKGSFLIHNNTFTGITGNFMDYYSNTTIRDNIIQGSTIMKRYGGTLTDINNVKSATLDALKLDVNLVPTEGSPAYRDTGDAGAFQAVRKPKTIIEQGTIQVETTGTVVEVYVITPTGVKVKIK